MTAAPRTRVQRRPVHGVVLLDKPLGLSSNQALQKVRWLLRAEKAGHTGTLDPLATGVLPLCFGAATKFSQMHLDADKAYEATLRLGVTTTTGDAEGEVLQERPVAVSDADIAAVLERFTGPQQQVPPMHSALKKDGKALYEYARAGETVERPPRNITVFRLERLPVPESVLQAHPQGTVIKLHAAVSKGTYIRTLAEDIGAALGCGAHLIGLRRVHHFLRQRGIEERLLVPEIGVEHRLADTRRLRNPVDPRARQPMGRELLGRCSQERLAALCGIPPGSLLHHTSKH